MDVEVNGIDGVLEPADTTLYREFYRASGADQVRCDGGACGRARGEGRVQRALADLAVPSGAWLQILLYRVTEAPSPVARTGQSAQVLIPVKRIP